MGRFRFISLRAQIASWLRRGRPFAAPPAAAPADTPPAATIPAPHRPSDDRPDEAPPRRLPARLLREHVLLPAASATPWLLLPRQRNYRLYIPARLTDAAPLPLIVMIHGCRQDAESFARGTRMDALAERHGFALLYPEQAQLANVRRCWSWFDAKTADGRGECELVLAMIAESTRKAAIADHDVFIAGLSSGGALAALLAFHYPGRFRALAVHSGLPPVWPISAASALTVMKRGPEQNADAMALRYFEKSQRAPPPLLVLHGDRDGRVSEVNAGALVTLWRTLHERAAGVGPLLLRTTREPARPEQRELTRTDYRDAEGRLRLRGIRIHGLAHAWSGGDPAQPFFDREGPSASELMLAFFDEAAGRPAPPG